MQRQPRILVVDDTARNIKLMEATLAQLESLATSPPPRRVSRSDETRQPQDQVDNQNGDD